MRKVKRAFATLLIIVSLAVMAIAGWQLYQLLCAYKESDDTYHEIALEAVETEKNSKIVDLGFAINWDKLKRINPDIVGWIYSPNTPINYPVVQGKDNDFYLHHMFNRKYNFSGSIFVEASNRPFFEDANTIIYGHHMRNGSMFASLSKYKSQDYYKEHPIIYLLTPEQDYKLEVFAGFTTKAASETYTLNFATDEEYQTWIDRSYSKTNFNSDVQMTIQDKCVTLSTCAYSFQNARYVVQGKVVPIDK